MTADPKRLAVLASEHALLVRQCLDAGLDGHALAHLDAAVAALAAASGSLAPTRAAHARPLPEADPDATACALALVSLGSYCIETRGHVLHARRRWDGNGYAFMDVEDGTISADILTVYDRAEDAGAALARRLHDLQREATP